MFDFHSLQKCSCLCSTVYTLIVESEFTFLSCLAHMFMRTIYSTHIMPVFKGHVHNLPNYYYNYYFCIRFQLHWCSLASRSPTTYDAVLFFFNQRFNVTLIWQ